MVSIRRLLPLLLLNLTLSAENAVYNPCFQKNSQSIYTLSGVDCLAVDPHRLICHDPLLKIQSFPGGYKALNYDPFTRIYEVRSEKTLYPVKFKGLAKIESGTDLASPLNFTG